MSNDSLNTWRKYFAPQIREILFKYPDAPWEKLRKILRNAYPLEERTKYRVKIWYHEAKRQVEFKEKCKTMPIPEMFKDCDGT